MITLENVHLPYVLTAVNCQIPQGKLVGIMGANGSGKSTLLKAIAGILPLTQGEIYFGHKVLSQMTTQQKSQQFAYLSQSTQIHWDLSVYDVIALGLPYTSTQENEKVRSISAQFSITDLLNKPFLQLSGGEKARVQLARCCIKNSPLLIADEPIAALDPYYQLDIMEQLKSLTPAHTCLVSIHHLSLAYQFCDWIILLKKGEIVASGETKQVLTKENLANAFEVKVEIDEEKREIFGIGKF